MNEAVLRIRAITRADFLIRFRRPSTAVVFLLACVTAYVWVPDTRTGSALMQIAGRRALYNSEAMALATAALSNLIFGLVGFYMVSSAIRRDIESRTGFVIASTTVRNWEYLIGKFFGNVFFLSCLVAGFMLSCMVMQLLRGEAPLQPLVFFKYYCLLVGPVIVFVAVMALVFESIRFLSGKFGDIVYFFLWMTMLGVITELSKDSLHPVLASYFDVWGLAYVMNQVNSVAGTTSVAIGHSPFDASKPPFIFHGLQFTGEWLLARLTSALFPVPFLLIALGLFHRFNPVKIKSGGNKARRNWLGRINGWLKPLASLVSRFAVRSGNDRMPSVLSAACSDYILTLQIYPVALLLIAGFGLFSLLSPISSVRHGILPALFAVFTGVIADLATREKSSGTTLMLYAGPAMREKFIFWKLLTGSLLALSFFIVPMLRLVFVDPGAALSLAIGCLFTAALSVFLGTVSGNPKSFIVVFLLFWYVVLNSAKEPHFDFAGWYGIATNEVRVAYVVVIALLVAAAQAFYRFRLKRAW